MGHRVRGVPQGDERNVAHRAGRDRDAGGDCAGAVDGELSAGLGSAAVGHAGHAGFVE